MNCKYCQQECQSITSGPLANGLHENRMARCAACNVDYFKGFHTVHCSLHNDDYYVIYMDFDLDHWTTVYHKGPKIHDIVLSFEFYVQFTPTNIKDKLSTYLLFS